MAESTPKSGEHHDTHNIVAVMQNMMADMAKANIRTDEPFLNADTRFDCAVLRSVLKLWGCSKHLHQQKKWNIVFYYAVETRFREKKSLNHFHLSLKWNLCLSKTSSTIP